MLLAGTDFIDNSSSFNTMLKKGADGAVFVQAYATSGMTADTAYLIQWAGSGYNATALAASVLGYVGIAEGGNSLASGCVGWVQIRGKYENAQGGTAGSFTGSVGHAVYWCATGLGATGSAYAGFNSHCAVLLEGVSSSTTANIYLTGAYSESSL